jgi:predicted phage terminase large subunit-like protein
MATARLEFRAAGSDPRTNGLFDDGQKDRRSFWKWRGATAKLIEDKANGSAVIQMLTNQISGIIPVSPSGGKIGRAAAISPLIEAGNIYIPHPQMFPWVTDFLEECPAFPKGAHDDQV